MASAIGLAALPVYAQSPLPFGGDYTGTQTSFTQLTPTTEEDFFSFTSVNASYGLNQGVVHQFATVTSTGFSLTPNTTSTFTFSATDGSSLAGTITSATGTFDTQGNQHITSIAVITNGTGKFLGATGGFTAIGFANTNASIDTDRIDGTIIPAPVPEASTAAAFGLLLALGLGGVIVAAHRKRAKA